MADLTDAIAKRWKELSGLNKWEGLLDPLDDDLRRYIIHYGEMTEATYNAFNSERASKYAGSSRYAMKNFFSRVGLDKAKPLMEYRVVKYFYATSHIGVPECFILRSFSREAWCKESNWMGYIAVATDKGKEILGRRDIVIAWRGTIQVYEWVKDFDSPLEDASRLFGDDAKAKVHRGWLSIYTSDDSRSPFCKTSAREQVLLEVKKLVNKYKDEEISISITGHSLGASLATLNAADIVANNIHIPQDQPEKSPCPVTAFGFACPQVGDKNFQQMVQTMKNLNILRVCNIRDVIQVLPLFEYREVGEKLVIDSLQSPFLKAPGDIKTWHNMEVYLHVIAGTQGSKDKFKVEVDRDIALVNKSCEALKDEFLVPPYWWCVHNKGMVQKSNGRWNLEDHETEDELSAVMHSN